jgi:hypothetical protein
MNDQDKQFNTAYARLAELGKCDSPGGAEYQRVKAEWIEAGRPTEREALESFIHRRANSLPKSDGA